MIAIGLYIRGESIGAVYCGNIVWRIRFGSLPKQTTPGCHVAAETSTSDKSLSLTQSQKN